MKKVIIFCDGGLGNRLGVLIGGILTSQKLNYTYEICWPKNTWCGCDFTDLFEFNVNVYDKNINTVFSENESNIFLIHENQTKSNLEIVFNHDLENINTILNMDKDVVYYHNRIPEYYSEKEILETLNLLKINKTIYDRVIEQISLYKINKRIGIHIRKTDFNYIIDESLFFNSISNDFENTYFVCSDDYETEKKFLSLGNVVTFKKKYYVEKLIPDLSWYGQIQDNEGRNFNFNVNRNSESVIEAFIDLLLLSRTKIIKTSNSSFLQFAYLYSKINL